MNLLHCELTLHDTLYFATREMGTLFETERYIHNYALAYALFSNTLLAMPFFCDSYRPTYANDLAILNEQGIYVTPAQPLAWDYVMVTWKIGQTTYYRKSEKFGDRKRNYPANIGRAKELAPGSTFRFYVLSQAEVVLPRWIRLGKWMSKAEVKVKKPEQVQERRRQGSFTAACALNPLDLAGQTLQACDIISMPPSSLITRATLEGSYYQIEHGPQGIPADMRFTVPV